MPVIKQKNSYMNGDLSAKCFDSIYLDGLRGYKIPRAHHLLILDSFSGHLSSVLKQRIMKEKTPTAVIPGGFTKEFQPLDVGINRSFKSQFRPL